MWDVLDWHTVWYTDDDWLWDALPRQLSTLCTWPIFRVLAPHGLHLPVPVSDSKVCFTSFLSEDMCLP